MSKERSKRIVLEAWEKMGCDGDIGRLPELLKLSTWLWGPDEAEKLLNGLAFDAAILEIEAVGRKYIGAFNRKPLEEIKEDLLFDPDPEGHLCKCGNPADMIVGGAWICERCYDADNEI